MDHVRGSSLASPAALETLRPFILTWWSGRTVEEMPEDVRAVYRAGGFQGLHLNIGLAALDKNGRVLRSYLPRVQPPAFGFQPESQGRDFKWQLDHMLAGVELPKVPARAVTRLTLPEVASPDRPSGVRIYLSFAANRLNHYRTPTVEAVPLSEALRKALAYPKGSRLLSAADLRPWLEQMYPPAIMDGGGGFRSIEGQAVLSTAGDAGDARHAVLEGDFRFNLDNAGRSTYTGKLSVALTYGREGSALKSLRGVLESTVPKGPEQIRMTAALESLPE